MVSEDCSLVIDDLLGHCTKLCDQKGVLLECTATATPIDLRSSRLTRTESSEMVRPTSVYFAAAC